MRVSRNRSVPVVAAMAALGITVAAVSCTGSKQTAAKPADKTTGPAIAKGDKTVEKPGAGAPASSKTPAAPAKPADTAKAPTPAAPAKPAPPVKPADTAAAPSKPTSEPPK